MKKHFLVRVLCVVALASLAAPFGTAHAKDWTNPVALAVGGAINISNPKLVVSNDGTAVIVWVEETLDLNPSGSIKYAVKLPNEKKFGAPQTLFSTAESNGIPEHEAQIAIDGSGNAIAAWLSRQSSAAEDAFLYAVKPSGSATFGAPQAFPRTGITSTWKTQFDVTIAANDAGVFWAADPMFKQSNGERIATWKGSINGFAEAEFASPTASTANGAENPLLAVTPDGNAYLYYQITSSPTKAIASFHNGAGWFTADATPNRAPKGIEITNGGSISDGRVRRVLPTSDGAALYLVREGSTFGLHTRASSWTTNGTTGSFNSPLVQIGESFAYDGTTDANGNGLAVAGFQDGNKGGLRYFFTTPQGLNTPVFLKSPANDAAGQLAVDMEPSGTAVMAFGTSSSKKKTLFLAFRAAGPTKKFVVEDKINTAKGILPEPISIGFAPKNTAVVVYLAFDKNTKETLYYSLRTNKNPPKKGNAGNKGGKKGGKKNGNKNKNKGGSKGKGGGKRR